MELDYEKAWEEVYDDRRKGIKPGQEDDVAFWDAHAKDRSAMVAGTDYALGRAITAILVDEGVISPASEVLEIGCGPGTLLVPLAKHVKKIVAADPSAKMLKCMMRNANAHGINNASTINKNWQDVDVGEIAGSFDLVVSVNVFWQFRDIREQVMRMEKASGKYCCIVEGVGSNNSDFEPIWRRVVGKRAGSPWKNPRNVQNLLYGILYDEGRFCNVRMTSYDNLIAGDSLKRSLMTTFSRHVEIDDNTKAIIEAEVDRLLERCGGDRFYRSTNPAAVTWWESRGGRTI